MRTSKVQRTVWKYILNCMFLSFAVLCSIPEVNAANNESVCDRAVEEDGTPYSKTMTLTANDGSSVLVKLMCPLRQSHLEVSVYDQKTIKLLQEFRVGEEDDRFLSPDTKDVNLDGYPDLMFPVSTGNVNSWNSIWFYDPGCRCFRKVLEEGFVNFFKDKHDFFVASGRASCCSWEYHFYSLSNWELKPQFAISVDAPNEQDNKSRCRMWTLPEAKKHITKPVRDEYLRETYCSHYDEKHGKKQNDH